MDKAVCEICASVALFPFGRTEDGSCGIPDAEGVCAFETPEGLCEASSAVRDVVFTAKRIIQHILVTEGGQVPVCNV